MRFDYCACGNAIYFENTQCLQCGRRLGFLPDAGVMSPLAPDDTGRFRALHPMRQDALYRQCRNYAEEGVCNWMVPRDDLNPTCRACRLNDTIPNLTEPRSRLYWARLETAKRRLIYTLDRLALPVIGRTEDPQTGLAFAFLADQTLSMNYPEQILTGHDRGLITINLAEADDARREAIRENLGEPYRTLLGHFRHESGHYYWERLIRYTAWLTPFRKLFGDERTAYGEALATYYRNGPPPDWKAGYVSSYATVHPWEDWAETWAHFLHMVDTLETADSFGLVTLPRPPGTGPDGPAQPLYAIAFTDLMTDWTRLTTAVNALNRSMGQPDAYPFTLSPGALDKLRFIDRLVAEGADGNPGA